MDGEGPLSPHGSPDPSAAPPKPQTIGAPQARDGVLDSALARVICAVAVLSLTVLGFLTLINVWIPDDPIVPRGGKTVT